MSCTCVNIQPATYAREVLVSVPDFMRGRALGCYVIRDQIGIDACLLDEIRALWDAGITTTGCCCGHQVMRDFAYIGVADESDVAKMKQLGYSPRGDGNPYNFIPKSVD